MFIHLMSPQRMIINLLVKFSFVHDCKLACQVFFWVQLNFPRSYKHIQSKVQVSVRNGYEDLYKKHRRAPNWSFRKGKLVSRSRPRGPNRVSSILSDFIGCERFGTPELRSLGYCSLEQLPTNLQHANEYIVFYFVTRAKKGRFSGNSNAHP